MKNWKNILCLAALTVGLASCGELFDVNEVPEGDDVAEVNIDRHAVDLMVGDSYKLTPTVTPDTLLSKGIYWEVADSTVVSIVDGVITAKSPGETDVRIIALAGMKSDVCHVRVYQWEFDPYQFRYDMVVYADVTVGGQAADANTQVAAFGLDETGAQQIRGLGVMRQSNGRKYMQLRLYSNEEYDDVLTLRCYDRRRMLIIEGSETFDFSSNTTIGTLSSLYNIVFE